MVITTIGDLQSVCDRFGIEYETRPRIEVVYAAERWVVELTALHGRISSFAAHGHLVVALRSAFADFETHLRRERDHG